MGFYEQLKRAIAVYDEILRQPHRTEIARELRDEEDLFMLLCFSEMLGLPNPAFNENMPPGALVRAITLRNVPGKEIHAVTIGDYFKYRGTVEFMESLARANSGGFLALAQ